MPREAPVIIATLLVPFAIFVLLGVVSSGAALIGEI
jgi:hypothetical protein